MGESIGSKGKQYAVSEGDIKHMESMGSMGKQGLGEQKQYSQSEGDMKGYNDQIQSRDSGINISHKSSIKGSVGGGSHGQVIENQPPPSGERGRNNSQALILGKIFVGGLPQSCCTDDL